ncbi:MAG TPA: hypothetical protein VNQ90_02315, partial [Chthoniobacteraceae bacterium]|nr:hypothetical protein [Chthoniobacteraceae bacterium]
MAPPVSTFRFKVRQRRSAGISLLEIILVLFFVALLAVLVPSALVRSRQETRRVQCVAHLRELYLAHARWMQDHGQTLPLSYAGGSYHGYGSTLYQRDFSRYLPSLLKGRLTGGSPPYVCPADLQSRGGDGLPGYFGYSYGANGFMAVRNQNHAARWTNPAITFLFADAVSTFIYGNDSYPERIDFRHRQQANFIFLDGHAA